MGATPPHHRRWEGTAGGQKKKWMERGEEGALLHKILWGKELRVEWYGQGGEA
jgi:hypothetical protein